MKSMLIKKVNLSGLELSGDQPLTPRTKKFFQDHNALVTQQNGFLKFSGTFTSFTTEEVKKFLEVKAALDEIQAKHNEKPKKP